MDIISAKQSIRLINLSLASPIETQAYYHAVAETMAEDTPDTIIICRPSKPYLCIGYHQDFGSVLNPDECARRNLAVFRRRVGGGATYLDSNQLFYQVIFHHSRVPIFFDQVYARLLAAPVAALQRLGLNAKLQSVNEIEVDGKRIAGIGGGRIGEACVVVGNLLFDFDFETMSAVWQVPWESFRDLGAYAMQAHIVTLNQLTRGTRFEDAENLLLVEFSKTLGRPLQRGELSQIEKNHFRTVSERLQSKSFLNLRQGNGNGAPMRSLKIAAGSFIHASEVRLSNYELKGSFYVNNNRIHKARLHSTPEKGWEEVEAKAHGVLFENWQNLLPNG